MRQVPSSSSSTWRCRVWSLPAGLTSCCESARRRASSRMVGSRSWGRFVGCWPAPRGGSHGWRRDGASCATDTTGTSYLSRCSMRWLPPRTGSQPRPQISLHPRHSREPRTVDRGTRQRGGRGVNNPLDEHHPCAGSTCRSGDLPGGPAARPAADSTYRGHPRRTRSRARRFACPRRRQLEPRSVAGTLRSRREIA